MTRRARGAVGVSRPTRVAIVLDDLCPEGAQRAAVRQAACLDPGRWQVEVASLELRLAHDWDVRLSRHVAVRRPGLAGLASWLRAFAPDVVHAHLAHAAIACGVAVPFAGSPAFVATCHDVSDWQERRHGPVRLLARAALHRCDAVVAVSDAVRAAIAARDSALAKRTRVLRNGTDLSAFAAVRGMRSAARDVFGYRPGAFVVGAVARLDARKGLDVLLGAASLALHRVPGLEVLIVGDGPERARLDAQARELGLASRVRFVGEKDDVRPYLAALDLFAAPARTEGLGNALVEALASGVPAAGAPVGEIPEVLDGGAAGWLVPSTAESWAEALVRAARAPDELARLSAAGLERSREFSIENTRERLGELYRTALGESPAEGLDRAA